MLTQEILCISNEGLKIVLKLKVYDKEGFCILSYFFPVNDSMLIKEEFLNKSYHEFNNRFFKLIDSGDGFLDRKCENRMIEFLISNKRLIVISEYKQLANELLNFLEEKDTEHWAEIKVDDKIHKIKFQHGKLESTDIAELKELIGKPMETFLANVAQIYLNFNKWYQFRWVV
jgi:hypothetical protein